VVDAAEEKASVKGGFGSGAVKRGKWLAEGMMGTVREEENGNLGERPVVVRLFLGERGEWLSRGREGSWVAAPVCCNGRGSVLLAGKREENGERRGGWFQREGEAMKRGRKRWNQPGYKNEGHRGAVCREEKVLW